MRMEKLVAQMRERYDLSEHDIWYSVHSHSVCIAAEVFFKIAGGKPFVESEQKVIETTVAPHVIMRD